MAQIKEILMRLKTGCFKRVLVRTGEQSGYGTIDYEIELS